MAGNQFFPPIEIPWQLVATTRPLNLKPVTNMEQRGPTLSLFIYYPDSTYYEENYPDNYLIYIKFSASIAPSIRNALSESASLKREFFSDLFVTPVKRVLLDLKVQRSEGAATGDITPYFLSAAPRYRSMIESDVLGGEQSSKSSSGIAIGKSTSSLTESYSSTNTVSTTGYGGSAGIGIPGFFSIGGSASHNSTTSTVNGSRDVTQGIDVTNRQAAEERKELTSHFTSIENVMTLLTAHNIGSPYLRFSMWPPPLRQPSINIGDPYEWYASLLRQRSSGIEGMQEFFAVVAVPREVGKVCIHADLRSVSVPQPASLPQFDGSPMRPPTPEEQAKMLDFVTQRFPKGTPIDELDVDFVDRLNLSPDQAKKWFDYAVVHHWYYLPDQRKYGNHEMDEIIVFYTSKGLNDTYPLMYKFASEVWLEMLQQEYQTKLLTHPYTYSDILVLDTKLECCIPTTPAQETKTDSKWSVSPIKIVADNSWKTNLGRYKTQTTTKRGTSRVADSVQQTVMNWNRADAQLTDYLITQDELRTKDVTLEDPAILNMLFHAITEVDEDHPSNLPISEAKALGISEGQIAGLQKKGIATIRDLAESVMNAPLIEHYNVQVEKIHERIRLETTQASDDPNKGSASRPSPLLERTKISLDNLKQLKVRLSSEEARQLTPAISKIIDTRLRVRS